MIYKNSYSKEVTQELSRIIKTVCDVFEVTPNELTENIKLNGYSTKQMVLSSYARMAAMSFMGNHMKQVDIANIMNCRVPSTVSAAKTRLNLLININPMVRDKIIEIFNKLKPVSQ